MADAPTLQDVLAVVERLPFEIAVSVEAHESEALEFVDLEDPHGDGIPLTVVVDGVFTPVSLGTDSHTELFGQGDAAELEAFLQEVLAHRAVEEVGRRGSRLELFDATGHRVQRYTTNWPPRRGRGVAHHHPPYRPRT